MAQRLAEFGPRAAEVTFWFLVLTSWVPLLAGFENVLGQLNPVTWYWQGAGRKIALPLVLPFAAITIATLLAGLASQGKRWVLAVVGFTPPFLATLTAGLSDATAMTAEVSTLTTLYLASVLLSAVIFVYCAHLRSSYVALFLGLAAVEAISALISGTPVLTFGRLFRTYALSVVDVFFFAIVIIFARFLVLVLRQNIPVLKHIWRRGLASNAAQALYLWFPMLVIFFSMNFFWSTLESYLDTKFGGLIVEGLSGAPVNPTLEQALKFTEDYVATEAAKRSQEAIKSSADQANKSVADLINSGLPAIRASFPPYLMKPSSCGFFDIFCHVMNGIKSVVNSVYRKARDVALNEVEREARTKKELLEKRSQAAVTAANQQIETARQRTSEWTKQATTKVFSTVGQIAFLLAVYSAVMLIKTYFIVLARVVFRDAPKNPSVASLRTPWLQAPASKSSPVKVTGNEFVINKSGGRNFFVATSFEVRDAVPNFSLPQPFIAILGRLVAQRYSFGFVKASNLYKDEATIVVNPPNELVQWTLEPDEEVVIRYRDIVAFTEGTRLETEISVSIPALIFGRFGFYKLVGPGIVIVRTEGDAVVGRNPDADEGRRVTALKAWNVRTGFHIQANLGLKGTYLASYNIRKQPKDDVIYDTAPQTTAMKTLGLATAIRIFLMPF